MLVTCPRAKNGTADCGCSHSSRSHRPRQSVIATAIARRKRQDKTIADHCFLASEALPD